MTSEHGVVLPDPDRRYWRRRANRRVRKARRVRSLLRWLGVVALNLTALGLLAFSGNRALHHITESQEFSLRSIVAEGARRCSPDEIRAELSDLVGHNLVEIDLQRVAARVKEQPWVRDCALKRVLPHTLRISIVEREPAAVASIAGNDFVVDRTGYVVEPAAEREVEALPLLTGVDRLDDGARTRALRRGAAALERLRETSPAWAATVSRIDLSDEDCIEITTREDEPRLLLDPDHAERNLGNYLALRREIGGRVGAIEYVDLRWRSRIAVMPGPSSSVEKTHGQD